MEHSEVHSNDRTQRQQPPSPPTSPSHNHKRAFHRKVKTGCLTCRRRHVKCDEVKPQCDMCTKKGYVCSGYPRLTPTRLSSVLQVPDIRGRNEYQAFQFFMEVALTWFEKKTRTCISECHVDEFWDPVLIQITESEPAIKHILLAWAELHRRILYEEVTPEEPFENDFFWQNHCQALRILGGKKQIDVSVMLVACIMFCILEKFRGHTDNFLQHLQSGIRILHDYDQKSADSKQSICDNMIARYIRPLLMAFQLNLAKILENDSLYPDGVLPTRRVKLEHADRTVKSWN